jgi:glycosyltransferase involved in cell wall biosynthesis
VVVLSGELLLPFPQLAESGKPLVLEATYPYTFESLQLHSRMSLDQQLDSYTNRLEAMARAALAGDHFFCANERQRDYWLGVLDACGRINPHTYAADPTLRQLIDIVPFGLPSRPPEPAAPAMRGVIQGIDPADRVVLWGGGLWQWLDPLTLVRAIGRLVEKQPNLRLVFPATRHPNPLVSTMPMLEQTQSLSDRLGLTGTVVFFGDWVPYDQWPSYLLEADIGASLHFETLETHFAFRTRMLDYMWAGLPMVVNGGDTTSDLVTRYRLGEVVPPGDDEATAAAIDRLLKTPDLRQTFHERFEQVRPLFTWEVICKPIVRFCERARLAPDRAAGAVPLPTRTEAALSLEVASLQAERKQQQAQIDRLQALINDYEQGRFIRFMRWMDQWRRKIG